MAFKFAIALTGGIASGKSSTTTLLSLYGFNFIDSDKIAHKLLDKNINKISFLFGNDFIKNNLVDRVKLGKLIFSNKEEKLKLEKFIHPLIYKEIEKKSIIQDKYMKPYIIDIPLFFEKKTYPISKSLLIYCSKKQQLERVIKRDKFSKEEAIQRINSQMDIEEKRKKALYIINNSKDLKNLQKECEEFKKEILNEFISKSSNYVKI